MSDVCEMNQIQMYSDLYNIEPAPKTEIATVKLTSVSWMSGRLVQIWYWFLLVRQDWKVILSRIFCTVHSLIQCTVIHPSRRLLWYLYLSSFYFPLHISIRTSHHSVGGQCTGSKVRSHYYKRSINTVYGSMTEFTVHLSATQFMVIRQQLKIENRENDLIVVGCCSKVWGTDII